MFGLAALYFAANAIFTEGMCFENIAFNCFRSGIAFQLKVLSCRCFLFVGTQSVYQEAVNSATPRMSQGKRVNESVVCFQISWIPFDFATCFARTAKKRFTISTHPLRILCQMNPQHARFLQQTPSSHTSCM